MKKIFSLLLFSVAAFSCYAGFSHETRTTDDGKTVVVLKYEAESDQNYLNNNWRNYCNTNLSDYKEATDVLILEGDFAGSTGSSVVCDLVSYFKTDDGIELDLSGTAFTSSYTVEVTPGTYESEGVTYNTNFYEYTFTCDLNIANAKPNLVKLTFPESKDFTAVPNDFFRDAGKLKAVSFPDYIEVIGPNAFTQSGLLEEIRMPVKLKYLAKQCFQSCISLKELDLSMCTSLKAICYEAFEKCGTKTGNEQDGYEYGGLSKVIFPSGETFTEMQNDVFYQCYNLDVCDMSVCEGLEAINRWTFGNCKLGQFQFPPNITEIGDHAFYQSEIVNADMSYCHKLTSVEMQAFAECDSLENVKFCSHPKVIYGSVGSGAFYLSKNIKTVEVVYCDETDVTKCVCQNRAFDYDVTEGQTATGNIDHCAQLIFNYDGVATAPYKSANDFFVGNYKSEDQYIPITHDNLLLYWRQIPEHGVVHGEGAAYYAGNGWLEFLNTGNEMIIPKGEFIRTYSRSEHTGPVLLPAEVHAYRALDYLSLTENEDGKTISGYVVLKELLTQKDGKTYSYVPENTGVVLWSPGLSETVGILMLPTYTGEDVTFVEYPNKYPESYPETGHVTDDDNTLKYNMLEGTWGTGEVPIAPVWPWDFDNNIYETPKEYRNFGLTTYQKSGTTETVYIWRRIKPGTLRMNRAYAKLPVERFTNDDENTDQMPDLNMEDNGMISDNGTVIGIIFEGSGQDAITNVRETVKTDDAWYTLQGVKVEQPVKGIYIHNRQKVVVTQ